MYLPSKEAEKAYHDLCRGVWSSPPTPCSGRGDVWDCWDRDGVEIPTDEQAQRMCEGCPVFELCARYAEVANPVIGVYAGKVYGRGMVLAERAGLL